MLGRGNIITNNGLHFCYTHVAYITFLTKECYNLNSNPNYTLILQIHNVRNTQIFHCMKIWPTLKGKKEKNIGLKI